LRLVRTAARNNAEWCDAFCRTHGVRGRFRPGHPDSSLDAAHQAGFDSIGKLVVWLEAAPSAD
jgi:hypothetical protein